jgi:hypothetical protein
MTFFQMELFQQYLKSLVIQIYKKLNLNEKLENASWDF